MIVKINSTRGHTGSLLVYIIVKSNVETSACEMITGHYRLSQMGVNIICQ